MQIEISRAVVFRPMCKPFRAKPVNVGLIAKMEGEKSVHNGQNDKVPSSTPYCITDAASAIIAPSSSRAQVTDSVLGSNSNINYVRSR